MVKRIDTTDIIGNKYGKLTVIAFDHVQCNGKGRNYYYYYRCKCDCGKETLVRRNNLIKSNCQKSCGCESGRKPLMSKNAMEIWDEEIDKRKYDKAGNPKRGHCRNRNIDCAINELLHRCCHDCDRYPTCQKRCKNTPDKCRR